MCMELLKRWGSNNAGIIKFLCVGVTASGVHALISWIFYYHIWCGKTILSTLIGYTGGWIVSYMGNRLWSFRQQTHDLPYTSSLVRFVMGQLSSMLVLLSATWIFQQLLILYFYWYVITNGVVQTPELKAFYAGASYPPALLIGMGVSALLSYLIMKKFVFQSSK